jgi:EAL domain-containing protein (putative c-di-GMP-specific phosphodiesterase class I)
MISPHRYGRPRFRVRSGCNRRVVLAPTTNERDAVIVRSTIERGRNLGLHVIAEGVEDIETWNDLASTWASVHP